MNNVAGSSDRIRLVDAATVQCGSPEAQAMSNESNESNANRFRSQIVMRLKVVQCSG